MIADISPLRYARDIQEYNVIIQDYLSHVFMSSKILNVRHSYEYNRFNPFYELVISNTLPYRLHITFNK
jgi:hypothetical protein